MPDAGPLFAHELNDFTLAGTFELLELGSATGLGIVCQQLLDLRLGQTVTDDLVFDVYNTNGFRKWSVDQFVELFKRHATQDCFDMTDAGLGKDLAVVLVPTAVRIISDIGHNARLHGILVDVTEEGGEVVHVVDRLGTESLLEEMTAATVLAVVVIDVGICNTLDGLGNGFLALTDEQVEVVGHQTVGVVGAALGDGCAVVVVDEAHAVDAVEEELIVFLVLEDNLVVDTTHHDVVDSSGGGAAGASGHGSY